ncbi:MAG: nuclear transport factor 2 family protein [Ilumatobacteraceae bacterium]
MTVTPVPIGTDDYVAIQRLIHRYADAVVHRDGVQWASTWAEDATWDLGRGRLVEGRDAIVELWYAAMGGMAAVVQMVHNGEVWADEGGDADRATGRWYIDERFRRSDGTNSILLAHYDDGYVRTADGWRFSRRFLQPHYMGPPDLTADFTNLRSTLHERGVAADV